jgi:hypothetical protein
MEKINFSGQPKEKILFLLLTTDLSFDLNQFFFFFFFLSCHIISHSSSFLHLFLFVFILHRMMMFLFQIDLLYVCFCSSYKPIGRIFPIFILFFSPDFSLTIHFNNVRIREFFSCSHFFSQFLTAYIWKTPTHIHIYIYIYIITYEHINYYKK